MTVENENENENANVNYPLQITGLIFFITTFCQQKNIKDIKKK